MTDEYDEYDEDGLNQLDAQLFAAVQPNGGESNFELTKSLIEEGADVNARAGCYEYPLLMSAVDSDRIHTDPRIINLLLDEGAHIQSRDSRLYTPLMRAAMYGTEEIVELLLDRGANLEARNDRGDTTLLYLCHWTNCPQQWNIERIKFLIGLGADTTVKNNCGDTCISLTRCNRPEEIINDFGKLTVRCNVCEKSSTGRSELVELFHKAN